MSKWYVEDHSRGITYYCIWLFFLWVLSFKFSYEDYEVISWILIIGGFFGSNILSTYQFKKEYNKLKDIKSDIKSELYREIYTELMEELREELIKKRNDLKK